MKPLALLIILIVTLMGGCAASVPLMGLEESTLAKQFNSPTEGKAGLYVYRLSHAPDETRNIWVDGECLGDSAANVFFYVQVEGGVDHVVSTESEFKPYDLQIHTKTGQNYFVRQSMRMGILFKAQSALELVSEDEGKERVSKLKLAERGNCSKSMN